MAAATDDPPGDSQILVRSTELRVDAWICIVVSVVAVVVGPVLLVLGHHGWGVGTLLAGLALLAISVVTLVWRAATMAWVEPTAQGFLWIQSDGRGEEFVDRDVVCAAHAVKPLYKNDVFTGWERRFTLWLDAEGRSSKQVWTNVVNRGDADPLEGLIQRITQHLLQRARQKLAAGEGVGGEGWLLRRTQLSLSGLGGDEVHDVAELTAVETIDDQVCIWRRNREDPICRLPLGGANACLLNALLAELVQRPEAPAALSAEPSQEWIAPEGSRADPGLGRVLFERHPNILLWVYRNSLRLIRAYIPTMIACIAGLLLGPYVAWPMVLIAVFVGLRFLMEQNKLFRCHESGISLLDSFSERRLLFTDVETFVYAEQRYFVNGSYMGSAIQLKFLPRRGSSGRPIVFQTDFQQTDQSLAALREQASQVVASRLAAELAARGEVAWLSYLTLRESGLEYRARGLFGRRAAVTAPWNELTYAIQDGVFYVWRLGTQKPVHQESTAGPNFFPGYVLLTRLHAGRQ